jgi:hypothetical protein
MNSDIVVVLVFLAVLVTAVVGVALARRSKAHEPLTDEQIRAIERRNAAMRENFNPQELARRNAEHAELERIRKEREAEERAYQIALAKARANGEPDPPRPPTGKPMPPKTEAKK